MVIRVKNRALHPEAIQNSQFSIQNSPRPGRQQGRSDLRKSVLSVVSVCDLKTLREKGNSVISEIS